MRKAQAAMYIGWLVNGLPIKLFPSTSSEKDRISAIVLAEDIDNSLLFG
jgi:hypothetical protein